MLQISMYLQALVSMNGSDESEVYLILRSGDNRSTMSIHEGVIFIMFIFQKKYVAMTTTEMPLIESKR